MLATQYPSIMARCVRSNRAIMHAHHTSQMDFEPFDELLNDHRQSFLRGTHWSCEGLQQDNRVEPSVENEKLSKYFSDGGGDALAESGIKSVFEYIAIVAMTMITRWKMSECFTHRFDD